MFHFNSTGFLKLDQFNDIGKRTQVYINKDHYDFKNIWLVKAIDLNRGRCIRIADSLSKIEKLIKKFYDGIYRGFKRCERDEIKESDENCEEEERTENKKVNVVINNPVIDKVVKLNNSKKLIEKDSFRKYRTSLLLIQKYIEKPLLYYGRKFDIRIWVLINHKMDVYVFKEGHLKTSSIKYDVNSMNSFVHLTNYSVQKYNDNFSQYEKGNEVSFKDFQDFLDLEYPGRYLVSDQLLKSICELITISMISVKDKINPYKTTGSFEIFGFDFIMDINFKLYLLEVNTNPGLEFSSPLIRKILPRMIDDALRLTIDDLFETKYIWEMDKNNEFKYISPYPVDNYSGEDNLFHHVCKISN